MLCRLQQIIFVSPTCRLAEARNNMPHFIFATPLVSVDHNKFQPTQSAHIAEIKSVTSSKLRCHTTRQKLVSKYQHFLYIFYRKYWIFKQASRAEHWYTCTVRTSCTVIVTECVWNNHRLRKHMLKVFSCW